jgi:hypothetical protein
MPSKRGRSHPSGGSGESQPRGDSDWTPTRPNGQDGQAGTTTNGYTGRYLVLFRQDAAEAGLRLLRDAAAVQVVSTADFDGGAVAADALSGAEAIYFDKLGVAVVQTSLPEQMQAK